MTASEASISSPRSASRAGHFICRDAAARPRAWRAFATSITLGTALLLGACAGGSPPVRLYQLRADAPGTPIPAATANAAVWQVGRVQLPSYLDRDTLLLPVGQSGLQPLGGHRWAEPLADAVPRLLKQDLARLMGADKVWGQPLPAGVAITRQLQVEIQRLEAEAPGNSVVAQARWTLVDPLGKMPAQVFEAELHAPSASKEPDALVTAHRAALWQLALRIAQSATGATGAASATGPAGTTGAPPAR